MRALKVTLAVALLTLGLLPVQAEATTVSSRTEVVPQTYALLTLKTAWYPRSPHDPPKQTLTGLTRGWLGVAIVEQLKPGRTYDTGWSSALVQLHPTLYCPLPECTNAPVFELNRVSSIRAGH